MIIYGKNPVLEALKCGKVRRVYIKKGTSLFDVTFSVPVQIMGKQEFEGRFSRESQGIAAEVDDIVVVSLDDAVSGLETAKGVVILDRIQDPHNYGAIIRSAHCFGIEHIIVPRYHQAPITAAVCKASAGSIFYITVIEETNLVNVAQNLKELGFHIFCCDMDAKTDIHNVDRKNKAALIVGSEGRGIREGLLNIADTTIRIPMYGKIDSLNAAQSAAIALYEIFSDKQS